MGGASWRWEQLAVLEADDGVSHCYPSIINVEGYLVTAYSVYDQNIPRIGIKVSRTQLEL